MNSTLVNIFSMILAYFFMEFVAWFSHKYIMHGFLWRWHKDHHTADHKPNLQYDNRKSWFEKNDLFFLIYAIPAIVFIIIGASTGYFTFIYVGIGFTLYGLTYFIIHDLVVHKRLPLPLKGKKQNPILRAIIKAHTDHHWPKTKTDFNNFGLLFFPRKYFKL